MNKIDLVEAKEWLIFASKLMAQVEDYVNRVNVEEVYGSNFNSDLKRTSQELHFANIDISKLIKQVEDLNG